MKKINFTCPECGSARGIDATDYNAVVVTAILGAGDDGEIIYDQNSHEIIDGSDKALFSCLECGKLIIEGDDNELYQYLKSAGFIDE